ncbi:DME family drug/metabolite transporter [Actinomadura algeriensis]|uniref:DME family drug/metabolite transporter n=1 Tax=Actinomadura algeriensis TaxID=1679523 RepID=A0ABR9K0X8_9ACTN|nr:EamA family transporter [Actinomadura algeriensis]MBE1536483.1 DME family drug/metabolite transporter [Actinomadura algeriensis]
MYRWNDKSGTPLVLAAGVLWGTVGPAQVMAAAPASPVAVGGARILFGGAILAVVALARDRGSFAVRRDAWPPVLAAAAATGTFQAAFFSAVDRTGAAVATAVVFGLVPVSTGVCERLVLGVRQGRAWWAGTACAMAGVALLMAPQDAVRVDPAGIALGLVAGCCFGVYTVAAKLLTGRGVGMAAAVSVTLLAGGAVLLPWTIAALPALAAPRGALLVGWLGVAATAVAYMCFVAGLGRVGAATAGTLSLVEPLVAVVLAVPVLGEPMPAPVVAGTVLLLGGLVVVSAPRPRRRGDRYDDVHATGAVKVEATTGERP